jgi:hypothetical protein
MFTVASPGLPLLTWPLQLQALMIIIGNPAVLVNDLYWTALMKYCQENHAVVGCPLPDLAAATAAQQAATDNSHHDGSTNHVHQQQVDELERLLTKVSLAESSTRPAQQQQQQHGRAGSPMQEALLTGDAHHWDGGVHFSGLVEEAGGGMVRYD